MTVDIAELRRLLAEATRGPWTLELDDSGIWLYPNVASSNGGIEREADARMIVALVNAAPELLDRLESAERECEKAANAAHAWGFACKDATRERDEARAMLARQGSAERDALTDLLANQVNMVRALLARCARWFVKYDGMEDTDDLLADLRAAGVEVPR